MNKELGISEKDAIWKLADTIEEMYQTRKYTIPELPQVTNIPEAANRRVLKQLNYYHGIQRAVDNNLSGRPINGVYTPEKLSFLLKYIYSEADN